MPCYEHLDQRLSGYAQPFRFLVQRVDHPDREAIYGTMGSNPDTRVYFVDLSGSGWTSATFSPSDRNWIEWYDEVIVDVKGGSVTINDSLWMFNSCRILCSEPCSLAVMDPMSNTLHHYLPAASAGDTLWFDLEGTRAWLLSRSPFQMYILNSRGGSTDTILFSTRRYWFSGVTERMEEKARHLSR